MVVSRVQELRSRPGDSEKITINLGYVDLGHIDLMVQDAFYSNRTDFIRTAIRNQLDRHADVVRQSVGRKALEVGLRHYSRGDLETARDSGELLHINVLGLASIAQDVTPNWRVPPSPRSPCWAPSVLVPGSKPRWRTGDVDGASCTWSHARPTRQHYRCDLLTTEAEPVPNWDACQGPTRKKATTMDFSVPTELLEATRLTKAGQLTEATAALQRMLGAGMPASGEALRAPLGPPTIDGVVHGAETTQARLTPAASRMLSAGVGEPSVRIKNRTMKSAWAAALRGFVDKAGHGDFKLAADLGDISPASVPENIPDDAKFLACAFSNQAGSRPYKLYVPSGYHGQPVPLIVMLHGCTQSPDDFAAGARMNVAARASGTTAPPRAEPKATPSSPRTRSSRAARNRRPAPARPVPQSRTAPGSRC